MSTSSPDLPGFDFWDFVSCGKCRMPFALDNGSPTVPFWLSECGHVICNSHLSPDRSCSLCGARDIEVTPLQREMERPMSDWFQAVPNALADIASSVKYQQETLASQIRYYHSRHQQMRQLIERLKRDVSDLKRENDAVRGENEELRLHNQHHINSDQYMINSNGKRQMVSGQEFRSSNRPRTGSSPRLITTPIGPNRLTLQPGQPVPELSAQSQGHNQRPSSSRSLECVLASVTRRKIQYAYRPPENHTFYPQTLTHAQAAPRVFQRSHPQAPQPPLQKIAQPSHNPQPHAQRMPPPSSRFKPTSIPSSKVNPSNLPRQQMGPPPTPQNGIQGRSNNGAHTNQMFLPSSNRQQPGIPLTPSARIDKPSTSSGTQRFFPSSKGLSTNPGAATPFAARSFSSTNDLRAQFWPAAGKQGGFS